MHWSSTAGASASACRSRSSRTTRHGRTACWRGRRYGAYSSVSRTSWSRPDSSGHVIAIERAELLAFLRRDLAVEHARLPAAQLALDLARRARTEQNHEELLVRRELALFPTI